MASIRKSIVSRPRMQPDAKALKSPEEIARHLAQMQDGIFEEMARVATAITANAQGIPIGGVVFHFAHLAGSPTPGANFQKADGSAVTDTRSPMLGATLPDMISSGLFVRAAAASGSGTTQADGIKDHVHSDTINFTDSGHSHTQQSNSTGALGTTITTKTGNATPVSVGATATATAALAKTGTVGSMNPVGGSETRPANIAAVPYIRIW